LATFHGAHRLDKIPGKSMVKYIIWILEMLNVCVTNFDTDVTYWGKLDYKL
jgi:hypothetical protein